MYGIIVSALNTILHFLFKSVFLKVSLFTILYIFVNDVVVEIFNLLPRGTEVTTWWALLPSSIGYFLQIFRIDVGIPMILSAYVTRFFIRRIPLFG